MMFLAFIGIAAGSTPTPTAEDLLAAIDQNLTFETRYTQATMTVETPRRTRAYTLETWGRGADEAATSFLAPPREAGTRMLKKGGEIWIWMPSIEKVQKLSGHMLRQGMMGSDISYEDMLEFTDWLTVYDATVTGQVPCGDSTCWAMELNAKTESVSYPRRVIQVDLEKMIPVRQELYALSGTLLKVWTMENLKQFGTRWYPMTMRIEDKLQAGSQTTLSFEDLQFTVELEEEIFSRRWLER
jgi:outer membrane lipoprotein-sorting protein